MNNLVGGIIGAVVAGLVGAGIWSGITYSTGYEIGWIAWGVGALVGFGALMGARREASPMLGGIAVAVSILALLTGKYITIELLIEKEIGDGSQYLQEAIDSLDDPEYLTSYIADGIAVEYEAEGKPVEWPSGVDPEYASESWEYPEDVWADAQSRWDAMNEEDRELYRQGIEQDIRDGFLEELENMRSEAASQGFLQSFGLFDVLFFFLAVGTAFKLASGGTSED